MTYIPFSFQPITGDGVWVIDFSSYPPFNSQSWDLLVQTQRVSDFIFPFPLLMAYDVTIYIYIYIYIDYNFGDVKNLYDTICEWKILPKLIYLEKSTKKKKK